MKKALQCSAVAAVLVLSAGCATTTVGNSANVANIGRLQVGVTTLSEAEALLGRPTNVTRTQDGTVISYVRMEVKNRNLLGTKADVDSDVLTLFFDQGGKLLRYGDSKQTTQVR